MTAFFSINRLAPDDIAASKKRSAGNVLSEIPERKPPRGDGLDRKAEFDTAARAQSREEAVSVAPSCSPHEIVRRCSLSELANTARLLSSIRGKLPPTIVAAADNPVLCKLVALA
jgi:hypothetical protein